MNRLKDINCDFKVRSCKYLKNVEILNTDRGRFVIKEKKKNNYDLFKYLEAKNFHNYLNLYDYNDNYEIYPYIDNINITDEEKALDIVYLISMLHNKTTFYKVVELDTIKKIYEDVTDRLTYITNYYDNLKIIIENTTYMAPSGYLLLRNSTIIYNCIDRSRYFINKWYDLIKNKKNFRVATIHNYLELDHLLKSDDSYLISWDKSCKASPIYDLISLYNCVYDKVSFSSLFDLYNSKYPLLEEEYYLLFALLLIPDKVELINREIINTRNVYIFTNRLLNVISFVTKYYSENASSKAQ